MSGNVWKWCFDRYDYGYYSNSPSRNPVNTTAAFFSHRVRRGGSWSILAEDCRVAIRNDGCPGIRNGDLGMRLVLLP